MSTDSLGYPATFEFDPPARIALATARPLAARDSPPDRVMTYALFLREEYPAFSFDPSLPDPGGDPRVRLDITPALDGRNRLTIFFRVFLLIPQIIVFLFVAIALYFVVIVAWFAVLILGRRPEGLRHFALGFMRWNTRLNAYANLLTDKYPPFSLH